MFPSTSMKSTLVLSCILISTIYLLDSRQVSGNPVRDDDQSDLLPANFFQEFPVVIDCKADEEPKAGHLPECEPTCERPNQTCPKIYTQLDFVPCFCKKPLVRDVKTKNCVRLENCPKKF